MKQNNFLCFPGEDEISVAPDELCTFIIRLYVCEVMSGFPLFPQLLSANVGPQKMLTLVIILVIIFYQKSQMWRLSVCVKGHGALWDKCSCVSHMQKIDVRRQTERKSGHFLHRFLMHGAGTEVLLETSRSVFALTTVLCERLNVPRP